MVLSTFTTSVKVNAVCASLCLLRTKNNEIRIMVRIVVLIVLVVCICLRMVGDFFKQNVLVTKLSMSKRHTIAANVRTFVSGQRFRANCNDIE